MLDVLRHYLPLRKSLLILSESALLTLAVLVGMSSHLWRPSEATLSMIAFDGLDPVQARWRCLFSALMVSLVSQVAIGFNELYDFRVSSSPYDRASRFLASAGSAILMVLVLLVLMEVWGVHRVFDFPGLPLSQVVVLLTTSLILGFTLLYFWRNLFHFVLRRRRFDERLLVLGSGRLARRMVDDLLGRPYSGLTVVGVLPFRGSDRRRAADDPPAAAGSAAASSASRRDAGEARGSGAPLLGEAPGATSGTGNPWFDAASGARAAAAETNGEVATAAAPPRLLLAEELRRGSAVLEDAAGAAAGPAGPAAPPLDQLVRELRVDRIVVAFEERRGRLPTDELLRCRLQGVPIEEAEDFYEKLTGKIPAEAMRPSYLIFNRGFVQHPLAAAAKRSLDVVLSLVGIVLALPLMAATALAIRLDSPGPILFRQVRTGRHGEPFTLLKFRSMRQDAEKATGPVWAQQNDPRITKVGGFLRRSRLDELPQLFNVLGGSMSLVGPRPERPPFVAELAGRIPYYEQRHIVKPGVTGWAQINYPYGNTIEDALQKLQYDLFYIKNQSLLFDLSILLNTVKTVVLRKGT